MGAGMGAAIFTILAILLFAFAGGAKQVSERHANAARSMGFYRHAEAAHEFIASARAWKGLANITFWLGVACAVAAFIAFDALVRA